MTGLFNDDSWTLFSDRFTYHSFSILVLTPVEFFITRVITRVSVDVDYLLNLITKEQNCSKSIEHTKQVLPPRFDAPESAEPEHGFY